MQNKSLIYKWQIIANVLPYLGLGDMLNTCSVSKEWNYNVSLYVSRRLLPPSLSTGNALAQLKMLYDRTLCVWENGKSESLKLPFVPQTVEMGSHVFVLKIVSGEWLVCALDLLNKPPTEWLTSNKACKLGSKFTYVRCVGDWVYCVKDNQLWRYQPNQEQILAQQQYIECKSPITNLWLSFNFAVLALADSNSLSAFSHNTLEPFELDLPHKLDSPQDINLIQNNLMVCYDGVVQQFDLISEGKKSRELKMFTGKHIWQIKTGYRHYLALERKQKLISQMNTLELVKWAEEQGFDDYIKIIKSEKVTGKKLLQMDKSYMEDVLGLTNVKIQQKLQLRVQECNIQDDGQYQIYGIGRNDKCQLGLPASHPITNPAKIKLPDNFKLWKCLGDLTLLRNPKTSEVLMNSTDKEQLWIPLSRGKVWSVASYKPERVLFIAAATQAHIEGEQLPQKKQKLRTAKNIMDKIIWDEHLQKEHFRVGYLDKYTGMLETSLEQLLHTEVKEYRIMYFKHHGKVVWDKKERIDLL